MPDTVYAAPAQRIAALRAELAARKLDAFILPRFDAHQGEYVAPHDRRLAYVTGFTGSAGVAVVTQGTVALFVDGRYSVQAANECKGELFAHHHIHEDPPEGWLLRMAVPGWRVGFDAMHLPPSWYDRLAAACDAAGAVLVPQSLNPVDAIWPDQPAPPKGRIRAFPQQFAGKSSAGKCADLVAYLEDRGADFLAEAQPDNIAWLLNLRGADVAFNPVPHSFLLVERDGAATWFVDAGKLDDDLRQSLPAWLRIAPPEEVLAGMRGSVRPGQRVLIDPDFSPVAFRQLFEDIGASVLAERSALTLTKAIKNPVELEGMRACHLSDGVAWTEFSAWLAECVPARAAAGAPVTEQEAEAKMLSLRAAQPGFLSESFAPISAAAGNAAMCHYAASPERAVPILPHFTYLLDSGGHYETGTTDATRCFAFGPRPKGYDRAYTAVFKAFCALATLRFPPGTQGHHIDAICRRPLWDLGLDYDHGTGHGVGHCLSVHEHPQRIAKPYNPVDLQPGMVLSIEPGSYVANRYGIRIENLFEIVAQTDGFLAFRTLTFAPIQTDMLIREMLSEAERDWLNSYHAELRTLMTLHVSPATRAWMAKALAPL